MTPAPPDPKQHQIKALSAVEDVELAIINLIGDLASYRPGEKLVIFEGGGDSEFDRFMATELFPELVKHANSVSAGNKKRVRDLHEVLHVAAREGRIPFKVFSVIDKDGADILETGSSRLTWDVYHIENYLLEQDIIRQTAIDVGVFDIGSAADVYDKLRASAQATLGHQLRHELTQWINRSMIGTLNFGVDPNTDDISTHLSDALERSIARVKSLKSAELSTDGIRKREEELRTRYTVDLGTGTWKSSFRGRELLRYFVGEHLNGRVSYETFDTCSSRRCAMLDFSQLG